MANLYGDYIIDTEMQTYYSVTITHSYIEVGISSGNLYVYSFTYIYASVLKIHRQLSNSGVLDFRDNCTINLYNGLLELIFHFLTYFIRIGFICFFPSNVIYIG